MHEAAVKSTKRLLHRAFNGVVLTQEELTTAFCEIEGILNSHLLCYKRKPDQSTFILTPGHFLIGQELVALPEPAAAESTSIRLSSRYENLKNRIHSFSKTWSADYLSQLQQRSKWRKPYKNLTVGKVVLLTEKDAPLSSWPYGLVTAAHAD